MKWTLRQKLKATFSFFLIASAFFFVWIVGKAGYSAISVATMSIFIFIIGLDGLNDLKSEGL